MTKKEKKYYLQADGTMLKNKFMVKGGKKYRFTAKGVLVTNLMYEIKGNGIAPEKTGH